MNEIVSKNVFNVLSQALSINPIYTSANPNDINRTKNTITCIIDLEGVNPAPEPSEEADTFAVSLDEEELDFSLLAVLVVTEADDELDSSLLFPAPSVVAVESNE